VKRIGWVGFVTDKPFFEDTVDDYVAIEEPGIPTVIMYKTKKDARKRFQDVREVFVK
jgi:hypothetical protein